MADRDTVIRFLIDVLGDEKIVQLSKAMKDAGAAGKEAEPEVRALTTELNSLLDQRSGIDNLIKLKSSFADLQTQVGAAKTKVDDLNASFGASGPTTAKQTTALTAANKALADLTGRQNSLGVEVAKASGALEKSGVDVTNLAAAHANLSQKSQDVAQKLETTVTAATAAGAAAQGAGEKAKESGSAFGFLREHLAELISVAAAVEIALKSIEFVGEGIKGAAAVEASLSRVKALAGEAEGAFADMDAAVEKAAEAVNVDGEVAADALAKLASNGLSAKDAIDALVPTLQLAKIAQVDNATAAEEVARTLKAFNEPASRAQEVVDKLAAASHGAAGGLGALTNAAATLAPDAKAIGLNLGQTIDILGFLQSKGLDAEKSLRGLRTIFQELQNPASTLRGDLRQLGDDSADFGKAITALSSKTPLANAALLQLSGVGRSVVQTFGQAGPDALAKFSAQLGNTTGQAASTANALDANLNGALTRFDNVFKAVAESLGKPVLKPLEDELNVLSTRIREFSETENFKKLEADIGDFASRSLNSLDRFIEGVDWEGFGDRAVDSFGRITSATSKVIDGVSRFAGIVGLLSKVNDAVSIIPTALGAIYDAVDRFETKATGAFSNVVSRVRDLRESFRNVEVTAVPSFSNVESSISNVATAVAKANDETIAVRENMLKLGLSAEQAGEGVTKSGKAIVDAFDAIANSAKVSGDQVQLAFAKALSQAQTDGEVQALEQSLQKAFDTGRISADKFALGLAAAGRKVADLQADAATAGASLDGMGKEGETAAQTITTALGEARDKVVRDANDIAAALAAAIQAGSDPSTINKLKAQYDEVDAKLQRLNQRIKQNSDANNQNTKTVGDNTQAQQQGQTVGEKYADSLKTVGDQSQNLGERYKALGSATANATSEADRARVASAGLGLEMEKNAGIAQYLAQAMEGARQEFAAISPAAAKAFDTIVAGALEAQGIMREVVGQTDATTSALESLRREAEADFGGGGFAKYFYALEKATQDTRAELEKERTDVINQANIYSSFANSASASIDQVRNSASLNLKTLEATARALADGTYNAGLLGQQDLAPLRQAIDAAIAKVHSLTDAEKAAKDQLDSLGASLQDQLDQASGNNDAVENRRFAKQLADLKATAAAAGELASAQYATDVANANKLHALKLKQIADQAAAQQAATATTAASSSAAAKPAAAATGASTASGAAGAVYNVTLSPIIYGAGTQQMTDLARVLKIELDKIAVKAR